MTNTHAPRAKPTKPQHWAEATAMLVLMLGFALALLTWTWPPLPARFAGAGLLLAIGVSNFRTVRLGLHR
jgi:hypothetical protein